MNAPQAPGRQRLHAPTAESEDRVRLFVALELPPAARQALVRWREQALRGVEGLRLVDPEHLHVTLCFLGWCQAAEVDAIAHACERGSRPVAELEFGPASWLPPRRPGVLAVELLDPRDTIGLCHSALCGELQRGGWFTPEKRRYRPHVTVARVRRGTAAPPIETPPLPLRFRPPALTLFRSRLAPSGARYEALMRVAG